MGTCTPAPPAPAVEDDLVAGVATTMLFVADSEDRRIRAEQRFMVIFIGASRVPYLSCTSM